MKHTLHERCSNPDCFICSNGTSFCSICRGLDTSLTSECPGEPLTPWQFGAIPNGVLDFKNGHWFDPRYRGYVGTWEDLVTGFQFKTNGQLVMGSIWLSKDKLKWQAQRYQGDSRIVNFKERREAELYVRAADEISLSIALEAQYAS